MKKPIYSTGEFECTFYLTQPYSKPVIDRLEYKIYKVSHQPSLIERHKTGVRGKRGAFRYRLRVKSSEIVTVRTTVYRVEILNPHFKNRHGIFAYPTQEKAVAAAENMLIGLPAMAESPVNKFGNMRFRGLLA